MGRTFFLFLILIIVSINSFSQTKKETQDWIAEKVSQYAFKKADINYSYNVLFENDHITIEEKLVYQQSPPLLTFYKIPIRELATISFKEHTNTTWLFLRIKKNKDLIQITSNSLSYKAEANLVFDKSIHNDNMKDRLTKAFNKLVTLYGGTVIKEVF